MTDLHSAWRRTPAVGDLIVLVATYMGTDAVIQFRSPFDPVFVLAGLAGGEKIFQSNLAINFRLHG